MSQIKLLIFPAALISIVSIMVFGVFQYYSVKSNLYNSSGTVYFLYSTPAQALALFLLLKHQMPTKQALISAVLAIAPLSLIGYVTILAVYFQFGGRL